MRHIGIVNPCEYPRLRSCREQPIIILGCSRPPGLCERAEEEQLVLEDRTADTAAEVVQFYGIFFLWVCWIECGKGIVGPTVRVQRCISEVIEDASVKCIATAPRDKINLHAGLSETLIHIQLLSLYCHLLDAFQAWCNVRLGVSTKLHAARTADDTVDIVALVNRGETIPCASYVVLSSCVPWHELR